jgi:ATP-binding cassette subfamily B protein
MFVCLPSSAERNQERNQMDTATPARKRGVFVRGVRILRSHIATHPGPFAISVTGATVYAFMTVGTTIVIGRVTDRVIRPAFDGRGISGATILWGVGVVVLVALLRAAGIVFRRYFAGMTSYRMQRTLQTRIVDKYQQLPLRYHRSQPTGELMAHAEADVRASVEVINPLPYTLAVITLIVLAAVTLVLTDPFLALIGMVVLPGLAFINRIYTRKVEDPATKAQERIGDVSAVAHESFDGALVVKTLGRERAEVRRMRQRVEDLRDERIRMGRLRASFEPSFETIPALGIVLILAVGAWRVSTHSISIGELVQFVLLFELLAFPMRLIGFMLSDIPRAVVGYARIEGVLREPVTLPGAEERLPLPHGPLGVSGRHVTFHYGSNRVLDDLSFEIGANESVAIVGSTGSGKSTLAQLLVRLEDPDAGSIRLSGVDLRHLDPQALRGQTAIVFQESFLFADSVRDNIALGLDVSDEDVREAAHLAQADGFIRELPHGYATVLGERGVTLSGGQRQRVALARGLVRRPRLLILDDATSATDPTVEAAILEGLRRELQATLVVVAYRVSTISLAHRVLFLEDGRIAAEGSHADLLRFAPYEAMVRAYERGAA